MADEKSTKQRAQSSELGAGTGFTFEDAAGAFFLTALLSEGYAPGIENRIVRIVSFQRKTFGEPLDDLIVDFTAWDDYEARLSLQVKRSLTISAATSNEDFCEVIGNSWRTFRKRNFRQGKDRVGVAVGEVSLDRSRAFETLCQTARASIETDDFMARFANGGNASADVRSVTLSNKLAERLTQSRFVQITGLPGSGKSAVLRRQIESDLARGPVLFLKSDRLEGRGWAGFATHYGLTARPPMIRHSI